MGVAMARLPLVCCTLFAVALSFATGLACAAPTDESEIIVEGTRPDVEQRVQLAELQSAEVNVHGAFLSPKRRAAHGDAANTDQVWERPEKAPAIQWATSPVWEQ